MIPRNINRIHVIKAIREIDRKGIPRGRDSKKFQLLHKGKYYPPKYVISLANKYANGLELDSSRFSGGRETNYFLQRLGFEVIEFPPSTASVKPISVRRKSRKRKESRHDERCPECKRTIEVMLGKIYGRAEVNYRLEAGTKPEDYKDAIFYPKLKEIFSELQSYRGHRDFVRRSTLPRCDLFVPNPGFIVEFDESQHFTLPRKISLQNYPQNLKLGFSLTKWINLCEKIDARDNEPPFRDEQRAWYDTLRDFLPEIKSLEPTVRLYSKEMQWCSLDPEKPEDIARFRDFIENRRQKLNGWVATVILQSNGEYSNHERLKALSHIVDMVVKETEGNGVILFPGGWFSAGEQEARCLYKWVEENVRNILSRNERNIVVCLGIDGRVAQYAKDQIGIAITRKDIEAIGRKFHPAPQEKGHVELAKSHLSKEENKSRVFNLNGKNYFLCACYDSFGITQRNICNFGIDVILDLVHHFYKPGKGPSGAFYFARDGFAAASKQWACPVFGAAVFFDRDPKNWPSGVYWNQGDKDIKKWRYADNSIKPKVKFELSIKEGITSVRVYSLETIS